MTYRYARPNEALESFVRSVLIIEGTSQSPSSDLPIVTNRMPALLCHTESDPSGIENVKSLSLVAMPTTADDWKVNPNTTIVAYFFKPFAMACVFDIPAKTLTEGRVELWNWQPQVYNAVRTQLIDARTTSSKIEVLDHLLTLKRNENRDVCNVIGFATDAIMANSGKDVLASTLVKLGIHERTFQRIFKKYVGITPTQYRRICQFQDSFGQLRSKEFTRVSDVAFDNGFADQSHFIRSFKEFTKVTPNDYLKKGLKP